MFILGVSTPSNPLMGLVIAGILFGIGRPIIHRVSYAEKNPWLVRVLTASLLLHLLAAPLQIWVVDHFYSGIADWLRYDNQGASLASSYRHFDFSVPGGKRLVGDGMVSAITAGVFAIIGINQVGAFLIFSFAAWLGLLFFYRAFSLTFAGANHRRYAILLFFLPSLIFWTADVSKEAIMTLSLGLAAFGAAKILARRRGGFVLLIIGGAIGAVVRPNELLLLLGGFCIALLILPAGPRRTLGGVRRVGAVAFLLVLLGVSVYLTLHFLRSSGGSFSLQQISTTDKGGSTSSGYGSSNVTYSPGPKGFIHDIFTVLFDPLGYNAHGNGERLASLENLVIVGVILSSWRQLRIVVRASFARPYILLCVIYSLGFIYTFAALANLGLITRERTLLFPFLLVVLSIPLSPKGEEPEFDWELRRGERLRRRRAGESATPVPTPGGLPSGPRARMFRPTSLPLPQPVRANAGPAPPEDPAADSGSPTTDPRPPTD